MTEEELQQTLNKTSNFMQRQGLLKQLWKLRWQGEEKIQLSSKPPVVSLKPARRPQTPRNTAHVALRVADD